MKLTGTMMLLLAILVTGCSRSTRLGNPEYMPSNWLTMRYNAWQIRELPESYRNELSTLQLTLANERLGQYYNFYGNYTPEIQAKIKSTNLRLDQAFLDLAYSSTAIFASLSPDMSGLSETNAERAAGIAVTNNANRRMIRDDVNRLLLLDKPSMLSPFPVVQD